MNQNFENINNDNYSTYNYKTTNSFHNYNLIYDNENNKYAVIIDLSDDAGVDKPDPFPIIQLPE